MTRVRINADRVLTPAERAKRYRERHPDQVKRLYSDMSETEKQGARRRNRVYALRNPDRSKAKNARFRTTEKGAACYLYWNAKRRAQDDGLEFNLTKEWILEAVVRGQCQVTGLMFDLSNGRKPWAPSLDKRDPDGGYTMDNVQVVVWMYNACKWTFSHDDVLTMARALLAGERNAIP